ncbi:lipopolysaccharide biosynthesis protein [Hoylesella enoeca]|uniref:Lipopolysaccharide biosynthesis protein n=1 Tax=Hoylesella enoeca TaxID=76123 RepID=A0A0S2KHZ4_9BACT|nr:lipopolysaccharide biosynthesis protein [Hoylesella enoeca]ALO47943.1 lipopolysaccharide biosynthesis protein [Hoylesella enoeca]
MASELKSKTVHGLLWSSIDRFSTQGISFVFSIFLARILTPRDYGIVAMIVVFTAIAQSFVDSGFSSALIRKPDLNEKDKSTALLFNIVVGVVCYGILFLLAPLIANFYHEPILSPIVKITGLSVIFNSLCVVQRALFTIDVDFKTQAKISLICTLATGIIGLAMAYKGYGVWALVVQSTAATLINCLLLWYFSGWRPRSGFHKESFNYLFGYGSKLLASGLLDVIYNNTYPILIGKFYTPAQLGFYSRAQTYVALPSSNITGILQRVTFPILSSIQDDKERLAVDYRRILRLSAFIIFPLMIGMAAVADPLVRVLITSKWEGCIVYLQILCFSMMWYPIHAINLNLLQVKGRSDLFLRLEIVKKVLGVAVLCITLPINITAMCIGLVVFSIIALFINTYYTGKLINVGYLRQLKDLLPIFTNSLVMGGIAYFAVLMIDSNIIKLMIGTIVGLIYYISTAYLCKSEELKEVWAIIRRK